jgi:hypothetical protein
MCRSGARGGARLAIFGARVRCADVERGSADLARSEETGPSGGRQSDAPELSEFRVVESVDYCEGGGVLMNLLRGRSAE